MHIDVGCWCCFFFFFGPAVFGFCATFRYVVWLFLLRLPFAFVCFSHVFIYCRCSTVAGVWRFSAGVTVDPPTCLHWATAVSAVVGLKLQGRTIRQLRIKNLAVARPKERTPGAPSLLILVLLALMLLLFLFLLLLLLLLIPVAAALFVVDTIAVAVGFALLFCGPDLPPCMCLRLLCLLVVLFISLQLCCSSTVTSH